MGLAVLAASAAMLSKHLAAFGRDDTFSGPHQPVAWRHRGGQCQSSRAGRRLSRFWTAAGRGEVRDYIQGWGRLPGHGHNGYLDVWLELGWAGVALFALFLLVMIVRLARRAAARAGGTRLGGLLDLLLRLHPQQFLGNGGLQAHRYRLGRGYPGLPLHPLAASRRGCRWCRRAARRTWRAMTLPASRPARPCWSRTLMTALTIGFPYVADRFGGSTASSLILAQALKEAGHRVHILTHGEGRACHRRGADPRTRRDTPATAFRRCPAMPAPIVSGWSSCWPSAPRAARDAPSSAWTSCTPTISPCCVAGRCRRFRPGWRWSPIGAPIFAKLVGQGRAADPLSVIAVSQYSFSNCRTGYSARYGRVQFLQPAR